MGKFWNINPCSLCRSSVHLQACVWIVNCYFYKHGPYRKQKELMPRVDWENSCWVWMRLPNVALEKNSLGWGEQTLREHSELMVGVWENTRALSSLEPWDPPAGSLQQDHLCVVTHLGYQLDPPGKNYFHQIDLWSIFLVSNWYGQSS